MFIIKISLVNGCILEYASQPHASAMSERPGPVWLTPWHWHTHCTGMLSTHCIMIMSRIDFSLRWILHSEDQWTEMTQKKWDCGGLVTWDEVILLIFFIVTLPYTHSTHISQIEILFLSSTNQSKQDFWINTKFSKFLFIIFRSLQFHLNYKSNLKSQQI